VAPHSGTDKFAGRKFTFIAAGEEKVYELPDTVTFVAGKSYSFTFTLIGGITSQEPTLVVDGMTNCYIVAPNTTLRFSVSRAYTHDGTSFSNYLHVDDTTPYTGTFTAAIVWADAAVISGTPTVSGSGNSAIVILNTTADTGNAVVKICKSGNNTVWSYHIWVTDYDPNATGATYTNTMNTNNKSSLDGYFVFMDRNLGATFAGTGSGKGTGLFYQWGRKDPFPATNDTPTTGFWETLGTNATFGTIEYTIRYPGRFYTASTNPYDWYYGSTRNNTLWGHDVNGGTKTIYDPCPSGWRVPVNYNMSAATSPWYGFTKDNGGTFANGYNWGTNAVYPACGNRFSGNGTTLSASVGTAGYYWSASPYSSTSADASYLNFNSAVAAYNNNSRAYGYPVRCVQE
jgi:uncharacterized protein (TIGR02145 family)